MDTQPVKLTYPLPCWQISKPREPTLIILQIRDVNTIACQLWLDAGACHDPVGRDGLAHLFEHMIYSNGDPVNPANAVISSAFTSHDFAAHCFKCLPGYLEENLKHIENAIATPDTSIAFLTKEKEVIKNERLHRSDQLTDFNNTDGIMATYFHSHTYGIPVIGSQEAVDSCTPEDVNKFSLHHGLNTHAIILAGDISLKDACDLYERHLQPRYRPATSIPNSLTFKPAVQITRQDNVTSLKLAFPAPTLNDRHSVAASAFVKLIQSKFAKNVFPKINALGFLKAFHARRIIHRQAGAMIFSLLLDVSEQNRHQINQFIDCFHSDIDNLPDRLSQMDDTVNILENERMIENIRRLDDHIAHARYLGWLASVSKDLKQACHLSFCKSTASQLHEFSTLVFHPGGRYL